MDMNYNGIKVQKPANSNDGQEGGLQAIRDTTNLAGSYNKINCVNHAYTIVGKNVNGFEWNLYAQMDNYADTDPAQRREHVAFYSKANKFGTATNWAACRTRYGVLRPLRPVDIGQRAKTTDPMVRCYDASRQRWVDNRRLWARQQYCGFDPTIVACAVTRH